MPEESAVMEAPALDTGSIDTTSTDTSTMDTGTTDVIDSGDSPASGETGHLRGAELYRAVKEKLKSSGLSPAEQRSLRNAIHIAGKADQLSGGDLTRFEAERQAYSQIAMDGEESLTPEDLVETVRGDRQQLQEILNDIQVGAPKLIDELFTDHIESAKSLTTQAMDRLAQIDNDRFSNYVARAADSYLVGQGIDVQFAILNEFLPSVPDFPGKQSLISAIQKVYGAVNGLKSMANKKLDDPALKTADPTTKPASENFSERKEAWNTTAASPNQNLFTSEMTRAAGTRKITLTDQEKKSIRTAVAEEFNTRLAANTRYGDTMEGYLRSGNRKAYADRATAEGQKLLPSIVARHTNDVIDRRTSAKPAANGSKPAADVPRGTQTTKDTSGNLIQWLSGPPKSVGKQVDFNRTTNSMLTRNEAYLKGEKGLFRWKTKSLTA